MTKYRKLSKHTVQKITNPLQNTLRCYDRDKKCFLLCQKSVLLKEKCRRWQHNSGVSLWLDYPLLITLPALLAFGPFHLGGREDNSAGERWPTAERGHPAGGQRRSPGPCGPVGGTPPWVFIHHVISEGAGFPPQGFARPCPRFPRPRGFPCSRDPAAAPTSSRRVAGFSGACAAS